MLRRADTSSSQLNHWQPSKSTTGIRHSKTGGRGLWRGKDARTVAILGEPEDVPRPYGEELVSIAAESI